MIFLILGRLKRQAINLSMSSRFCLGGKYHRVDCIVRGFVITVEGILQGDFGFVWFLCFIKMNLRGLFKAISIHVKEEQDCYLSHSWENKGFHTFSKEPRHLRKRGQIPVVLLRSLSKKHSWERNEPTDLIVTRLQSGLNL